jgi:hypothetical protein
MRLFRAGNQKKPQKTRARQIGTTKSASIAAFALIRKTQVKVEEHTSPPSITKVDNQPRPAGGRFSRAIMI